MNPLTKKSKKNDYKIVVIVGPTASGKSDLAVDLAKKFNGEVISADSRQVYKGLDIGSGKITASEMKDIEHHLLDVVSPRKIFTAADFQRLSRKALKEIWQKNKLPIICGGTGLYINSLIFNYSIPKVKPQPGLREKLESQTTAKLFAELKKLDPERAKTIDKNNRRRLIRALEITITTGHPIPPLKIKTIVPPENILWLGLSPQSEELKNKIEKRLDHRLQHGLIEEVRQLHNQGLNWQKLEDFGLEYRWLTRFLQGQIDYNSMKERLFMEIWHYSKRQMTWFKKNKNINWLETPTVANEFVENFLKIR